MIEFEIMHWFKDRWGGSVYEKRELKTGKIFASWHIGANKAVLFLQDIIPYLKIKKPQAEILIEFQTKRKSYMYHKKCFKGWKGNCVPTEEIEFRDDMKIQINNLNQRRAKKIDIVAV